MLKNVLVAVALGVSVSAYAENTISPYVGLERETKAEVTFGYFGLDASAGGANFSGMAKFNAASSGAGDVLGYKLIGNYAVTKSLSVYTDTDLSKDFKATETKVGVKLNF